jgi:HlyD family secretion protein
LDQPAGAAASCPPPPRRGIVGRGLLLAAFASLATCSPSRPNTFQGYVEGEFVRVAAPFAGSLVKLSVQRGAQVATDAPLFILEQEDERAARQQAEEQLRQAAAQLEDLKKAKRPPEIEAVRAQKDQARAALRLAETNYRRDQRLAAAGFISPQQLDASRATLDQAREQVRSLEAQLATTELPARTDQIRAAEAQVKASQAALARAEWALAQKSVRSPVTGLVQDTLFYLGDWVPAGSPVVSLLPPENIKVRFFVPETRLGAVKIGQGVTVSCDGCAGPIPARISFISPQAEYTPPVIYSEEARAKLLFMVEARPAPADAPKLHPGQPVDVRL